MSWNDVLIQVVEGVVGLIISVVIPYCAYLISKKIKNEKLQSLIDNVSDIVADCVLMINQTFVDSLKKEGRFDAEAQAEAFKKCEEAILQMLSDEAKKAVVDVYGSLEKYIRAAIEANVLLFKK